jgi:hypothetical protein
MVYRKPWSFRLGVFAFGSIAFLAATGRSIGWSAPRAVPNPAPVVLDAVARS